MNHREPTQRRPWRSGSLLALLIAIGLIAYQTYLDRSAPPIRQTDREREATSPTGDPRESALTKEQRDSSSSTESAPYLRSGPRGQRISPAGLVYTQSSSGEHRADHVQLHAQDQPQRPGPHGVFDAQGDDLFRLLDEAYRKVLSNAPEVREEPADADFKKVFVVDMGREIGFLGGQVGQRKGHPRLRNVTLVLAEDRVITAFPD